MENPRRSHGKIAHGLRGAGTVTPEMVEERARELAVINGRDSYNQDDFREAKLELLGMENPIGEDFDQEIEASSSIRANPVSTGHRAPTKVPTDPQTQSEEVVQGGVDEAEHDTMLRGARASTNQE